MCPSSERSPPTSPRGHGWARKEAPVKYLTLALLLLILLLVFVRPARRSFVFLILRAALRAGLGDIGKQAMAKLPEQIHLTPQAEPAWRNASAVEAFATPLFGRRFMDAGIY